MYTNNSYRTIIKEGETIGAKSRIKNSKELLLFPDFFPRFRKRVEISNRGKHAHTLTEKNGKPTIDHHFPKVQCAKDCQ